MLKNSFVKKFLADLLFIYDLSIPVNLVFHTKSVSELFIHNKLFILEVQREFPTVIIQCLAVV